MLYFKDIDISGMSFDKYENYDTLSNGKFYLSNDDNIYIKLYNYYNRKN